MWRQSRLRDSDLDLLSRQGSVLSVLEGGNGKQHSKEDLARFKKSLRRYLAHFASDQPDTNSGVHTALSALVATCLIGIVRSAGGRP